MPFKSGFIAIIGRPNAGKSTLLNSIIGEKISIVSKKPQTTRNVIRGVKNLKDGDGQVVFIDTPGLHRARGLLNEFMVGAALRAIRDTDGIVYLVEATRDIGDDERFIMENLRGLKCPVILAINKIDLVDKRSLLPLMERYSGLFPFKEIVPVSALKGDGAGLLVEVISRILPEGPRYFPEDIITDQPERFIASEIIREKVFILTKEEIPYSTAVVVEEFKEREEKNLVYISAVINVERDSQKAIIIGKRGAMLKDIGASARADIEKLLGVRVYLELFVKVKKGWTGDSRAMKEFGYE
ncbi:MAG: GTPase Era [Deltaproteobacteria bacterium]|nr:GTPase Era [Deltaproteobacteria bacterium]